MVVGAQHVHSLGYVARNVMESGSTERNVIHPTYRNEPQGKLKK